MRILALENEPSSQRGGQERSLLDVCRGLAARGHAVELLYTREGDLLGQYRSFCSRVGRVGGYAVDRSRTLVSGMRLLADVCRPRRPAPEVIYANQYMDSVFARLLAWRLQRPFVCHLRLPPPERFCGQHRWGMCGATRLIAISRQTREDYAARGFRRERIDVVHNGIDVNACQPQRSREEMRAELGIPQADLLVAYAGRLHPSKGVHVLIDAFAALPAPAHLVIAGRVRPDGGNRDCRSELERQAEERGVATRCHFVGHLGRIADLFAAADVTVLPSLVSEGFGRVVIESMACGTPVVASRIGGIPEILTSEFARGLIAPGDAQGIARGVEALRNWRARDPSLATRCRAHVAQHFDIAQTVIGVERVLQSTLGEWQSGLRVSAATAVVP